MLDLTQLNDEQKKAVRLTDGSIIIFAGAGSGKTRVITYRIAHMIENGVNPFNILAITFTNKASKEMKDRIFELTDYSSNIWVSTFHSFCARILRIEAEHLGYSGNFSIYDSDDSDRALKNCIKELDINDKNFPAKSVRFKIGQFKDELRSPKAVLENAFDIREETIGKIYEHYQKKLLTSNAMDFDDLIYKTVEVLKKNPEILNKYQERFKYIMVDEYQDTSKAQYMLVKLLADKYKNICVVGDDDQSIYGWRGADVKNILRFSEDFQNTTTIKLEQNYRSTKNILGVATNVIKNNYNRKEKVLWTENNEGEPVKINKTNRDIDEADFVSANIKRLIREENYSLKDIAILYRTNAQSRLLEDSLIKNAIPYRLFGGVRFYERREIKDVLAYLSVISNPKDEVSLMRIINVPKRGIGDATVKKVSQIGMLNDISFFEVLQNEEYSKSFGSKAKSLREFYELTAKLIQSSKVMPVDELLKLILNKTGYTQSLIEEDPLNLDGRIDNIDEFVNKAYQYTLDNVDGSLEEFLQEISLIADIDNYKDGDDAVSLMTIHTSKGLEFPCVFLTGMEEGIFPTYRATIGETADDLEEERRLFYVAITRARKEIYLSSSLSRLQRGQINYNAISRFVREIPEEYTNDSMAKIKSMLKDEARTQKQKINLKADNYSKLVTPKNITLDFEVGDTVMQKKYGEGVVKEISPAGKDYEVSVYFEEHGTKKFMALLSKLKKV